MDWTRDLSTWSHPSLSRRVNLAPHRWHIQDTGSGPPLLLLPGAGASTHSFRDLIPLLAQDFRVIALDLPGHGFTQSPGGARSGLNAMAEDIAALIKHEGWGPVSILGHSAGAAVALRLTGLIPVTRIVGINPALESFDGVAGWLFPSLARILALNPFTAHMFTFGASIRRAERLIQGTGSRLEPEGYAFYARLMKDRDHVNGALNMMARWSLDGLLDGLPNIKTPCLFLIGDEDRAVPPRVGVDAAKVLADAEVVRLSGLGHLAHEEAPDVVLDKVRDFLGQK